MNDTFIVVLGIIYLVCFALTAFGIPLSGYAFTNQNPNKVADNVWKISLIIGLLPVVNVFTGLYGIVSLSFALVRFCADVVLPD